MRPVVMALGSALGSLAAADFYPFSTRDLEYEPKYTVEFSTDARGPEIPSTQLRLTTDTHETLVCSVPDAPDTEIDSALDDFAQLPPELYAQTTLQRGLDLLEGLRGSCIYKYRFQEWFAVQFCYGDSILQYHPVETDFRDVISTIIPPKSKGMVSPKGPNYRIGRFSLQDARVVGGEQFGGHFTPALIEQTWADGTLCEETQKPRKARVTFVCSTTGADKIRQALEVSICNYHFIIATPRLCLDPIFTSGQPTLGSGYVSPIECRPADGNSASGQRHGSVQLSIAEESNLTSYKLTPPALLTSIAEYFSNAPEQNESIPREQPKFHTEFADDIHAVLEKLASHHDIDIIYDMHDALDDEPLVHDEL